MSPAGDSADQPAASHDYADNTIHTVQTESGEIFEIRLRRSLGGDNGVGFSMACVFIAECVSKDLPRYKSPFVVKIFDPRYSTRLRAEFGLKEFSTDALPEIAEIVSSGVYGSFAEDMAATFEPPEDLSERTMEILSSFIISPLSKGDIFSQALANDDVADAFVDDGILEAPKTIDREMFVWVMSQQMFQHEATMHKYLNRFPEAPVARLEEVCAIKPKPMATSMPSVSFGATIMELVDGYPMSKLQELCMLSNETFQQAPAEIRKLIPVGKDSARRFFTEVNHLTQFPISVGVQSRDPNLDNVMCSADSGGKGTKLTWIDVGQFQPLLGRKFACQVNEQFEEEMYDSFSFVFRKVGYSSIVVHDLKLKRFRDFGSKISITFAWRLIMEDICINDWQDVGDPTDPQLSVLLIHMAKRIMDREKGPQIRQAPPRGGPEKWDWFRRAVLKLHYLLCSPLGEEFRCTSAGMDAVERFDKLMTTAGYPNGEVVAINVFSDNPQPIDEKCLPPFVEDVVKLLVGTRIFPTRFWPADWGFERIEFELRVRFDKVMKVKVDDFFEQVPLDWETVRGWDMRHKEVLWRQLQRDFLAASSHLSDNADCLRRLSLQP